MSYEIEYDASKPEDHDRAVADVLEYVGQDVFDKIVELASFDEITFDQFMFGCMMAGVQGFPVKAMWKYSKEALNENCNNN